MDRHRAFAGRTLFPGLRGVSIDAQAISSEKSMHFRYRLKEIMTISTLDHDVSVCLRFRNDSWYKWDKEKAVVQYCQSLMYHIRHPPYRPILHIHHLALECNPAFFAHRLRVSIQPVRVHNKYIIDTLPPMITNLARRADRKMIDMKREGQLKVDWDWTFLRANPEPSQVQELRRRYSRNVEQEHRNSYLQRRFWTVEEDRIALAAMLDSVKFIEGQEADAQPPCQVCGEFL
ncbi:hypothetical protein BCR39DRAFT_537482 [Naematelia encephala]|uniref:Uncharacterized protein n=1 Tax=Naematelia encephala TaxID=71784 RepID=A0A1Y2AYR2_9TREE|nr:hypothetical protein BCR39DRAFT_537482 [Naematelia encephala]